MMNAHNDDEHDNRSKAIKDDNDLHNLIEEHQDKHVSNAQITKTQLTMDEIFAQVYMNQWK